MENFGMKGLLVTLWQRVFVSYKTTFYGLALVGADAGVTYLLGMSLPTWAHYLVGVAASALVLVKERVPLPVPPYVAPVPVPPRAPKGFAQNGLLVLTATLGMAAVGVSACAALRSAVPVITAEVSQCGPGAVEVWKAVDACVSGREYMACLEGLAATVPVEAVCVARAYVNATVSPTPPTATPASARGFLATEQDIKTARAAEWLTFHHT